ncbi:MAG: DNA topoisomerase III [Verrucomicrobiales bacterium]|nr:DNA topoisomerase III [Verrucomicrobiales bacterium]
MGKALIIAEKPSVATDITRALGGFQRKQDYFENDDYVVSSAIGHLLEITPPAGVEPQRGKWKFENLPVMPAHFDLNPIEKTEGRLKLLTKLMRRKDVDSLINACDAGREGELIFRYIEQHARSGKPVQRLWLQSMTPAAIRDGFSHLRSDQDMRPLADAATCRSESDWLVGINGTRAMTAFNSKSGGFHLTTVGRVQTPTLAIVVEREQKIRAFVARDYWEVIATFQAGAGAYTGRWFDEGFVRPGGKNGDPDQRAERIWEKARAEGLRDLCLGKPGSVTEESKPTTQNAPLLYDLTSLQREANSRFGFSARNTLGIAQALYERHKVLTYPRTDSRALPEDYLGTVRKTLENLKDAASYRSFAARILDQDWVRPNKRVFNNARISDHFAIIPTLQSPRKLTEVEQKIYDMVTRRFLAVFFPAAEHLETTRITRVEGEPFKTEGKVLVKPGWLEVYGREAQDDQHPNLPAVQPGETVQTTEIEVKENQTKPPPRYTEATLLSAMEGAGKLVDDDELREAMAQKGLGTPATRAQIIENLIGEKYMLRLGKELQPTAKAFSLMVLLNGLGIEDLTKPELTGNWEYQLKQMELGHLKREEFMSGIRALTERIVGRARSYEHDTIPGDFGTLEVPCPKCGGQIRETYKKFQCSGCDLALWKIMAGRQFEPAEVEQLLRDRQLGPIEGFRSKQGRSFAAVIKLTPEFEAKFDFGDDDKQRDAEKNDEPVDFTGQEPLGTCPKCGGRIFTHGSNYVCEKAVPPDRKCKFRAGAVILQQALTPEQFRKLLAEGKTDLLKDFVSKRTGKKFEAFLVLKDGEVGFEFPPREKKKAAAKRAGADKTPPPKLDFTGQTALGKCPKCGGQVFEGPESYLCEHSQNEGRRCTFRIGKEILQQPIELEQARRLLAEGRTDLLSKFVSSKTGKVFSANLTLGEKGKVEFDFPPR